MLEIKECSSIGREVIDERRSIIVGISINNSYFKENNLEKLLSWASSNSTSVHIMIPDEPAVYTLLALGYTKDKAQREARLKANSLENKCLAIIKRLGLRSIVVVRWKDVVGKLSYLESLVEIKHAYDTDRIFKEMIRSTTCDVISNSLSRKATESEIDTGAIFLLQELAFITRSALILGEEKIAYVYHKTMKILKEIIEGQHNFKSSSVGFITVM